MDPIVQIWRCSKCGKWSHAKTQPKKHQRWVDEHDPLFDPDKDESFMDGTGEYSPSGHFVDCGPFTPYVASPGRYRR